MIKIKKVTNTYKNIIIKKKINRQANSIEYKLSTLTELKNDTNAPKNVIIFLNKHIMKIIKDNSDNKVYTCNKINNTTHVVIHANVKNIYKKLTDCVIKRSASLNKVYVEYNTSK